MPVLAQCGTRSRKGSAWSNCALPTHLLPRVLVLATLHLCTRFCTQWHPSADGSSLLPLSCLQRSVLLVLTRVSGSPPRPDIHRISLHVSHGCVIGPDQYQASGNELLHSPVEPLKNQPSRLYFHSPCRSKPGSGVLREGF